MEKSKRLRSSHSFNRTRIIQLILIGVIMVFIVVYMHSLSSRKNDYLTVLNGYDIEYVEENLYSLDQHDIKLIQYTRIKHLRPPSKLPYHFFKNGSFKDSYSDWVANFFKNKPGGIFIEAGANEGERGSHTLYLEKELGWTGLLIECNPTVVPYLVVHHRKAWIADLCLAPSSSPGILNFSNPTNWSYSGTFRKPWKLPMPSDWNFLEVTTIPLYSVLAAIGYTEIDYFSFDVEGAELSILKAFPFHLVTFKVLIVEVYFYNKKERKELHQLLVNNGYHFVKDFKADKIYVHDSVKHLL